MPVGPPAQTDDPVRSQIETGRDFYMRRGGSTANGAVRSYLQLFFGFSGGGSVFF